MKTILEKMTVFCKRQGKIGENDSISQCFTVLQNRRQCFGLLEKTCLTKTHRYSCDMPNQHVVFTGYDTLSCYHGRLALYRPQKIDR